ncbi:MAG TPA: ROK family protein [Ktedonobacteraceae bacterium]
MTLLERHEQSIPLIAEKVEALIAQAGIPRERLIGLGCAISGFIDSEHGICIDSWQLGWHHFVLASPLAALLQLPVVIRNNVSCIACYENLFGCGQDYQHFLTVAIGRGLGLGIVINGDIYGGAMGGAGEFGHTARLFNPLCCRCSTPGKISRFAAP